MQHEDPRVHLTRSWFARAQRDLASSERLLVQPELPAEAVFHCQQTVEKVLKGFLVWHNLPFRKTHDLVELGAQCVALDPSLEPFLRRAAPLTDYAWKFRYPGESDPSPTEADEALRLAREVYAEVLSRLPSEVHP